MNNAAISSWQAMLSELSGVTHQQQATSPTPARTPTAARYEQHDAFFTPLPPSQHGTPVDAWHSILTSLTGNGKAAQRSRHSPQGSSNHASPAAAGALDSSCSSSPMIRKLFASAQRGSRTGHDRNACSSPSSLASSPDKRAQRQAQTQQQQQEQSHLPPDMQQLAERLGSLRASAESVLGGGGDRATASQHSSKHAAAVWSDGCSSSPALSGRARTTGPVGEPDTQQLADRLSNLRASAESVLQQTTGSMPQRVRSPLKHTDRKAVAAAVTAADRTSRSSPQAAASRRSISSSRHVAFGATGITPQQQAALPSPRQLFHSPAHAVAAGRSGGGTSSSQVVPCTLPAQQQQLTGALSTNMQQLQQQMMAALPLLQQQQEHGLLQQLLLQQQQLLLQLLPLVTNRPGQDAAGAPGTSPAPAAMAGSTATQQAGDASAAAAVAGTAAAALAATSTVAAVTAPEATHSQGGSGAGSSSSGSARRRWHQTAAPVAEATQSEQAEPETPRAVLQRVHTPGKAAAEVAADTSTPQLAHSAAAVIAVTEAWREESSGAQDRWQQLLSEWSASDDVDTPQAQRPTETGEPDERTGSAPGGTHSSSSNSDNNDDTAQVLQDAAAQQQPEAVQQRQQPQQLEGELEQQQLEQRQQREEAQTAQEPQQQQEQQEGELLPQVTFMAVLTDSDGCSPQRLPAVSAHETVDFCSSNPMVQGGTADTRPFFSAGQPADHSQQQHQPSTVPDAWSPGPGPTPRKQLVFAAATDSSASSRGQASSSSGSAATVAESSSVGSAACGETQQHTQPEAQQHLRGLDGDSSGGPDAAAAAAADDEAEGLERLNRLLLDLRGMQQRLQTMPALTGTHEQQSHSRQDSCSSQPAAGAAAGEPGHATPPPAAAAQGGVGGVNTGMSAGAATPRTTSTRGIDQLKQRLQASRAALQAIATPPLRAEGSDSQAGAAGASLAGWAVPPTTTPAAAAPSNSSSASLQAAPSPTAAAGSGGPAATTSAWLSGGSAWQQYAQHRRASSSSAAAATPAGQQAAGGCTPTSSGSRQPRPSGNNASGGSAAAGTASSHVQALVHKWRAAAAAQGYDGGSSSSPGSTGHAGVTGRHSVGPSCSGGSMHTARTAPAAPAATTGFGTLQQQVSPLWLGPTAAARTPPLRSTSSSGGGGGGCRTHTSSRLSSGSRVHSRSATPPSTGNLTRWSQQGSPTRQLRQQLQAAAHHFQAQQQERQRQQDLALQVTPAAATVAKHLASVDRTLAGLQSVSPAAGRALRTASAASTGGSSSKHDALLAKFQDMRNTSSRGPAGSSAAVALAGSAAAAEAARASLAASAAQAASARSVSPLQRFRQHQQLLAAGRGR